MPNHGTAPPVTSTVTRPWNLNVLVTWSKAQGPLGLNWLGMEFQEFSEFFSETLVS